MLPEGERVVIAAMACRYPDADNPAALLQNSLDGRQSFRPIPSHRLPLADYEAATIGESDSITRIPAGLLSDWHFDARRFEIPPAVFDATDLAHWLALEVAADALAATEVADRLDRESTAVVVANTLTGEFSRAAALRLRWPWLDRRLEAAVAAGGIDEAAGARLRSAFRDQLFAALRTPDEETLAGGLSNTIAGRIANQFDLHGGAFTVDAACASSLVAVADAATLIATGRARTVIVAAVDLSLDPFELVGFSRNGALAKSRMRVFDEHAEGFWPGEGGGALILMAESEARRLSIRPEFFVAGWSVSTDGRGGLTRPNVEGQLRAITRAAVAAGVEAADIGYIEAHGTGTPVGDPIEVTALARFVGASRRNALPIASIKGNIGHTKAAAGMAGLIRTSGAMAAGIVPPHAGCNRAHPVFAETGHRVRVATAPEEWPSGPRVSGVSSFGFGGINAHVILRADTTRISRPVPAPSSVREEALFLFRAPSTEMLRRELEMLALRARTFSYSEVIDAAAEAGSQLGRGPARMAFSASSPDELHERLISAAAVLNGEERSEIRFGCPDTTPRLALVFPGQAAPVRLAGEAWSRLFPGRYSRMTSDGDPARTDNAQPAIARACLAGIELLDELGINAEAALGHSLGELAALAWAGAIRRDDLVPLAAARGQAMAALEPGAMLMLGCDHTSAKRMSAGLEVTAACFNAADETVMSGSFGDIELLEQRAASRGIAAERLQVSHAFHSPGMSGAASSLGQHLCALQTMPPRRPIASTVTGSWLPSDVNVRALLIDQLTSPVRFTDAVAAIAEQSDVLLEVGPGFGMGRLLEAAERNVLSLDVFGETTCALTDTLSVLFVLGVDFDPKPLFQGPGIRPLPAEPPVLLASPCGLHDPAPSALPPPAEQAAPDEAMAATGQSGALPLLIQMVAGEVRKSEAEISPEEKLYDAVKHRSLVASRIIDRLAKALGRRGPTPTAALANASLKEIAAEFDDVEIFGQPDVQPRVAGVAPWVRHFAIAARPLPLRSESGLRWCRSALETPRLEPAEGLLIELDRTWHAERDAFPLVRLCQNAVGRYRHIAIAHEGAPLSGFARSIAAERLFESVRLVPRSGDQSLLNRQVFGFEEIIRLPDGDLAVPELEIVRPPNGSTDDAPGTVMITGGAVGIGVECAIRLSRRFRCPLILVGRSSEADVHDVNGKRMGLVGEPMRYVQADVTDPIALRIAVARAANDLGPITHLVHAAGVNKPTEFGAIEEDLLRTTIDTKVAGLQAAIDASGPTLRRVITFGSVIARVGLAGEAHYALANAEQTRLLESIAESRPEISALSIEWSVWGGAGMGERLGVIERLAAEGVDALNLDEALDEFEQLSLGNARGSIVVSSRLGRNDDVRLVDPLRFIDRPLVHTRSVELVAETRVGRGRDPYLSDHRIDGSHLLPGVMLLEAMAQAASVIDPAWVPDLSNVQFRSAIDIGDGDLAVRLCALMESDGRIRTEVRCADDGFLGPRTSAVWNAASLVSEQLLAEGVRELDPGALYGTLFFHGPRFQRLAALGRVSSRHVEGWLRGTAEETAFGRFEPQRLLLGSPFIRDATLHALQCCVPHRRLVPVSAERIRIKPGSRPVRFRAHELWTKGDDYCFDILAADERGNVVEHWQSIVFHSIGRIEISPILAAVPALAQAWLERRAREETGDDSLVLALIDDVSISREARRDRAAAVLGLSPPGRRGDGKPFSPEARVSFAHSQGITIGVRSDREVGCDVEEIAAFTAEELALAWTAEEALRKMGSRAVLCQSVAGLFTGAASERIATFAPVPTAGAGPVAVAVGIGSER